MAYSWFWNCYRKPYCYISPEVSLASSTVIDSTNILASKSADTVKLTQEEQILFKPIDVYFLSGQVSILHTPEVDTFLLTAKKYLSRYPQKQLLITGYTDSDGSDELNLRLSKIRANKVKGLLATDGVNSNQMITEGRGEKEPIASNDTNEGKSKNRRATIRLKE